VNLSRQYFGYTLAFVFFTNALWCQIYHIPLDSLTVLDDPTINIEMLSASPSKPVRLPPTDAENRRFITEFYSWRMSDHPDFVIMVISKPSGDLLYIDKNLDGDLTNDGPPIFFPFDHDTLTFELAPPFDSKQRVRLLLSRTLPHLRSSDRSADTSRKNYVDELGNLNPHFAKFVGALKGETDFKGNYGSFYFDDRVTLRRGTLTLGAKQFSIGLFDFSNNGLYNDSDDVLIVDVHGNGNLSYLDHSEVFNLRDVFSLANRNFKIRDLNKYGTWVDLEETSQSPTTSFVQEQDSLQAASAQKTEIRPTVWDVSGTSMNETHVLLNNYRGQFLLLNFWGEWCKPCIEEIPALKRAWLKHSTSNFQIVSFIKTQSIEKANKFVTDSSITWPQVPLSDDLAKQFRISSYPTNILIFPNGKDCLVIHSVNDTFFKDNLR